MSSRKEFDATVQRMTDDIAWIRNEVAQWKASVARVVDEGDQAELIITLDAVMQLAEVFAELACSSVANVIAAAIQEVDGELT